MNDGNLSLKFCNNNLTKYIHNNNLIIYNTNLKSFKDYDEDPKNKNILGIIKLEENIFNPLYIKLIKKIFECICPSHSKIFENKKIKKITNINKLNEELFKYKNTKCYEKGCKKEIKKIYIKIKGNKVFFTDNIKNYRPCDVLKIFENLDEKDIIKIGTNPCKFILNYIPVIPFYLRPYNLVDDLKSKDIITVYYENILKNKDINVYEVYEKIIYNNNDNYKTIVQRISGKKGLFRNSMLGKRARLCGRTVITPDIFLKIDEIGLPLEMANELIINGEKIKNGDYVLFIRHPTLQRFSIMGMKIKIQINSLTIKMNPMLCPAYNADFDGDEMNIFCINNYKSICEAKYICSPINCILSPQNGKPVIYPSHDCLTSIYLLTKNNEIIEKNIFYNCLYITKRKKYKILKYSGKELFSLSLPKKLNYNNDNIKIIDGILIDGFINKSKLMNIIKFLLKNYGKNIVSDFMFNLQLITNEWKNYKGLSIGYEDCFIKKELKNSVNKYDDISLLIKNNNPFKHIIDSETKGSTINIYQIMVKLNQNMNYKNNYCSGLNKYEYYKYCQLSRQGIINTNIGTPRTGYMQRNLTKYLENTNVQYNGYITFNNYILI